jgi:hypothetical protein
MTVPQILVRAKISEYLATISIAKSGIFGGGVPSHLPMLIYQVRKSIEWMYDSDPDNDYLVGNANYLYALCGKFGLQASYLIDLGGSVAGAVANNGFRLPYIGVAGRGYSDDPVVGESSVQSDDLMGLGISNPGRNYGLISLTYNSFTMQNFGNNPQFTYNPTTGELSFPSLTFAADDSIYVDRNQ